mgnify:CR=1 FL=1
MNNIRTVILDMGGVVLEIKGTSPLSAIAQYYGQEPDVLKEDYHRFIAKIRIGAKAEPMFKCFSDKFAKPVPLNIPEIMTTGIKTAKLNEGLVNYLLNLKRQGLKLLVLSNSIVYHSNWIHSNGWYDYFDKVYLSQEIKLAKPDPRAFTYVIEAERVKPAEAVFVDDLQENLDTANRLGFKTVLAVSEQQVVQDLEELLQLS